MDGGTPPGKPKTSDEQPGWLKDLVLSLVGAVLAGVVVFLFLPLRFTAKSSILVSDRPDPLAGITGLLGAGTSVGGVGEGLTVSALGGKNRTLGRLKAILESSRVRMRLVRKYDLVRRLGVEESEVEDALAKMTAIKELYDVGLRIAVTCKSRSRLAEALGLPTGMSAEEAKQLCADLANEYVKELDRSWTETRAADARDTRMFIAKRRDEVAQQLKRVEDQLEALQVKYAMVDPERSADFLVDQTKAIARSFAESSARVEETTQALAVARRELAREDAVRIQQEVTARNPVIAPLEEKLVQLRAELSKHLAAGKTASHPDVVQVTAAIESIENQLGAVAEEIRQQVAREPNPAYDALLAKVIEAEVELAGQRALREKTARQLAQAKADLAGLPPVVRQYVTLSREREILTQLLAALVQRAELAAIEEQRENSGKFQVLDVAVPPLRKSGPSAAASAAVTFLLVFAGLSLLRAYRSGLLAFD